MYGTYVRFNLPATLARPRLLFVFLLLSYFSHSLRRNSVVILSTKHTCGLSRPPELLWLGMCSGSPLRTTAMLLSSGDKPLQLLPTFTLWPRVGLVDVASGQNNCSTCLEVLLLVSDSTVLKSEEAWINGRL